MTYDYDYDDRDCGLDFAEPGSNSALRAAGPDNPRNLPCPTCQWPNRLTPADVELGYQCNSCANAAENGWEIDYYEPPEPLTAQDLETRIISRFSGLYGPFEPTVTVKGAGTDYIHVTVTLRGSNAAMEFSCQVPSDDDGNLYFYHDATDTRVAMSYMDG